MGGGARGGRRQEGSQQRNSSSREQKQQLSSSREGRRLVRQLQLLAMCRRGAEGLGGRHTWACGLVHFEARAAGAAVASTPALQLRPYRTQAPSCRSGRCRDSDRLVKRTEELAGRGRQPDWRQAAGGGAVSGREPGSPWPSSSRPLLLHAAEEASRSVTCSQQQQTTSQRGDGREGGHDTSGCAAHHPGTNLYRLLPQCSHHAPIVRQQPAQHFRRGLLTGLQRSVNDLRDRAN